MNRIGLTATSKLMVGIRTAGLAGASVLKGVAQEVPTGIDPFSAALRERSVFPLAPGVRERWIAIYPSEISGRRFRRD